MSTPAHDHSLPSIRDLLADGCRSLAGDSTRLDCELLLAAVLERPRSYLYAYPERRVDASSCRAFAELLARRRSGEPVSYLTGRREFWTLDLAVNAATLVPRPETELLVVHALLRLSVAAADVLDLGTGSGAIALALASERPAWRVLGIDIDAAAVAVARANALRLGIAGALFENGSWYSGLADRRFALIVSNPPYIREGDTRVCNELRHEPRRALTAGADGMDALRVVIGGASQHLLPAGWLLCEHGADQGAEVRDLFAGCGFADVETCCDLSARERMTVGRAQSEQTGEIA